MDTSHWSAEQARRRVLDRVDWARTQGQRPRPVPQVPLLLRLKRRAKTAILSLPVVGPWLFSRARELKGWLARRGQQGRP